MNVFSREKMYYLNDKAKRGEKKMFQQCGRVNFRGKMNEGIGFEKNCSRDISSFKY